MTNESLRTLQHLLRHLNDYPSLRKNPLVSSLAHRSGLAGDELHARVRAIVSTALNAVVHLHALDHGAEHARRWRAIVQRCDLDGERHEAVAQSLGLSKRQFYRERRAAQESLTAAVMRELGVRGALPAAPSSAELQLESAAGLYNLGKDAQACELLESVVANGRTPQEQLSALMHLARLYSSIGRTAEIASLFLAARALCGSDGASLAIPVEILLIEALVEEANGRANEYAAALERVQSGITAEDALPGGRHSAIAVQTSLELAWLYLEEGKLSRTQAHLDAAAGLLERSLANSQERTLHLLLSGEVELVRGELARATQVFQEGLALARDRGLLRHSIHALCGLGIAQFHGRCWNAARSYANSALELAETLEHNSQESATLLALLAAIELDSGNARRSLEIAQRGRRRCRHAGAARSLDLTIAHALIACKNFPQGWRILEPARRELLRTPHSRFVGTGEWLHSQLMSGMDRRSEALTSIDNAVQLLNGRGSLYSLGRAYEFSAQLTGNRIHRRRAGEIKAQLALTPPA